MRLGRGRRASVAFGSRLQPMESWNHRPRVGADSAKRTYLTYVCSFNGVSDIRYGDEKSSPCAAVVRLQHCRYQT